MISRAPEPRRTVAALCARKLHESALALGLDPARLPPCEPHDADAEAFEARVTYDSQLALWEALMRATDDCGFPVAVGARSQPKDYDVIGFAYMTRANVREALELAIRYGSVWSDGSTWELTEGDRALTLTLHMDESERLGARCLTECLLAEIIHSGRLLTGLDVAPVEVRFRHRAPRDVSAIEAFFKAPVRFGAPRNQLVLDAALLTTPLLKADPDLAAFFARSADEVLERHGAEGLARRLRSLLSGELGRNLLTLESAAARLAVSPRTLRRRLQEEGTTFHDVLDATRCELAKRHLGDERIALGEVAFRLGFSEPSAFHRAFKRWTGQTPLAYRRLRAA
ncbi:MAG: AraC family transcriptional regulator [Byssovorax sp.]